MFRCLQAMEKDLCCFWVEEQQELRAVFLSEIQEVRAAGAMPIAATPKGKALWSREKKAEAEDQQTVYPELLDVSD